MKKAILFCLIAWLGSHVSAQISEGGLPASLSLPKAKSTANLPGYSLKKMSRQEYLLQDQKKPVPMRYAIFEDVNINLKTTGRKDTLPDRSGIIWRMKIECDSAYSLQVMMRKYRVPQGAKLFLYNEGFTAIAGAFTSINNQPDSSFVIADLPGNRMVLEYFEPLHPAFSGVLIIGSIGKAYKDIFDVYASSPYININCPEGRDLQAAKHAVCKMTFRSDSSSYLCSGALLNNARKNEIPYFLTANHCISTSTEASTLVTYFNYENTGCSGGTLAAKTLSGSTLITASPASDYTLLRLNNKPPASCQPYYAGWDANEIRADHVSGVHHPEGLTKKLAIDNDTVSSNTASIQWQGSTASPVGSHWQVNFDVGQTAGGSSGSPLFNKKKQVIGQLHGGDDVFDLYGKFSYSWKHPSSKYKPLRVYLDPDSTGILQLDGYYPATNPPDAFIYVPVSLVCTQAPIQLKDYSVFGSSSRAWTISPATYTYTGGTNASSESPVVTFDQAGNYTIKIRVSNSNGADSMTLSNAFKAGSTIDVNVSSLPEGEACFCNFSHFLAFAQGASTYSWNLLPGNTADFSLDRNNTDTVTVSMNPGTKADSTFTIGLQVTGTQGTCSDTALLTYDLIIQPNDSIKDASLIQYGKTATYSNKCATVESQEPVPPHYSCTTQYSWCDEYGTGQNIVEHSVWFKFVAADAKYLSVSSSGFDDEIAVYSAESYQDILNGNYTIVAANDDRSTTNYNPLINSAQVTAGKTYWIQVDGSGGGLTDEFFMQLTALTTTGVPADRTNALMVYPQPARDVVYISGKDLRSEPVEITVYSSIGTIVASERQTPENGVLTLHMDSWKEGVYLVKVGSDKEGFIARVIRY
jgi:hypothetical protein